MTTVEMNKTLSMGSGIPQSLEQLLGEHCHGNTMMNTNREKTRVCLMNQRDQDGTVVLQRPSPAIADKSLSLLSRNTKIKCLVLVIEFGYPMVFCLQGLQMATSLTLRIY